MVLVTEEFNLLFIRTLIQSSIYLHVLLRKKVGRLMARIFIDFRASYLPFQDIDIHPFFTFISMVQKMFNVGCLFFIRL